VETRSQTDSKLAINARATQMVKSAQTAVIRYLQRNLSPSLKRRACARARPACTK
jgi:hypothetical protein